MIPIVWREFTATMSGWMFKLVHCTECSTDYVYRMERTTKGGGTSLYLLDNEGALDRATARAKRQLMCLMQDDIDPVPCPACGHYQESMIPKMRQLQWRWMPPCIVALIVLSFLALCASVYFTVNYRDRDTDANFEDMVTAWGVFVLLCLGVIGLPIVKHFRFLLMDPNLRDQQERMAIGQSRAVTLAEFEHAQQGQAPGVVGQELGVVYLNQNPIESRTGL